jgi:hypothetical protein
VGRRHEERRAQRARWQALRRQLDGIDIENTKVLHEIMQKFDLGKLGEVK